MPWPPWTFAERPLVVDGAMGTMLIAAGLELPTPPEAWVLAHPEVVGSVHRAYRAAGAHVLTTCTFGATRPNLARHGLDGRLDEINHRAVELAREAAGGEAHVAGNLGPLVRDERTPADVAGWARTAFGEQADALAAAGVDLFLVETMADPTEAIPALEACRAHDVPTLVTLACRAADGVAATLSGAPARETLDALVEAGAAAVGFNCMLAPDEMLALVEAARPGDPDVPLVVQPNAGQPREGEAGTFRYDLDPAEFARGGLALRAAGASLLGGCCGTTPEHVRALAGALAERSRP